MGQASSSRAAQTDIDRFRPTEGIHIDFETSLLTHINTNICTILHFSLFTNKKSTQPIND